MLPGEPGAEGDFDLGFGDEANFFAAELGGACDVCVDGDEEAYAVAEDGLAEGECGIGRDAEGGDEVDDAGAEGGTGVVVVGVRRDGDACAGAEDGDGDGSAKVGIEGRAGAVVVDGGVLGGFRVGGAAEGVGLADVVEGRGVRFSRKDKDGTHDRSGKLREEKSSDLPQTGGHKVTDVVYGS